MNLFKSNDKQKIIDGLLNSPLNGEAVERLTTLQNEIGVNCSTKVIAITSIKDDDLAVAFVKAFASTYSANNQKTLVIDANLYNPLLKDLLKDGAEGKEQVKPLDDNANAICLDKKTYPSEVLKGGLVQKIINENKNKYDHFVVLVPSIKEHKEIVLLQDVITAVILVARKNSTKKEHIYDAIQYCAINKLPLAKTVILK